MNLLLFFVSIILSSFSTLLGREISRMVKLYDNGDDLTTALFKGEIDCVPQFLPIHFVGKTQNKISLPFSNSLFF
jgi:hypothetical protein